MSRARGVRRAAAAFGVAAFFSDVAHESIAAILPALLVLLGGTPLSLGVVEGAADAAAAVCKILAGRFADRRAALKPATVAGYAASAAALPLIGLAGAWIHVALLRGVALAARGFRSPLRDQLLTRSVPAESRGAAFGVERAMDQAGGLFASLAIAAYLSGGGDVRTIALATLVPGALATAAILLLVRERPEAFPPETASAGRAASAKSGASDAGARRLLWSVGVFGLGDFAVSLAILWAVGPESARTPAGAARIAGLYAVYKGVAAPVAYVAGRWSDRVGRRPIYLAGHAAGFAAAFVPVAAEPGFGAGLVVVVASGLLYGVQESVQKAWIADLAPPARRGRAFGALHALRGLTALGASTLLAALWAARGPAPAFGAAAALMAVGLLIAASVPGRPPRTSSAA